MCTCEKEYRENGEMKPLETVFTFFTIHAIYTYACGECVIFLKVAFILHDCVSFKA